VAPVPGLETASEWIARYREIRRGSFDRLGQENKEICDKLGGRDHG
jgi:hypothetical protein